MGALQRMETAAGRAVLTVDPGAVVANWRLLAARAAPADCAAVVKADAYGLGVAAVAPALARAGCRRFFVAHPEEGITLRRLLGAGPEIAVLHGPAPGSEPAFAAHALVPVLNSAEQAQAWASGPALPAILHCDTGMARLGVPMAEVADLPALDLRLVMSHLACADAPAHPANAAQLAAFRGVRARFAAVPASLAASFGIFLGDDYGFDLVRPGAALYGINPTPGANPMRAAVRLQAPVVQTREVAAGAGIGYGHTWHAPAATRLATLGIGYADGLPRSLGNRGAAWLGGTRLPMVGRVSMDSITVDASALPADALAPGTLLDLIGPDCDVDGVAAAADSTGYELLTRLGARLVRRVLA
jgi:alanine racemase